MKKIKFLLILAFSVYAINVRSNPDILFPSIKGWSLEKNEIIYNHVTLWEYINGAAESYLAYDFRNLYIARYSQKDKFEVKVEIYEHSSLNNAFGIYSYERMPDYNFVNIGVQGYTEQGILNFFSGKYYVKLESAPGNIADKEALMNIAAKVNSALGNTDIWPNILDFLPDEDKIPNTESYIARDFLGYSFFHSAFTAQYDIAGQCRMFIIELKNETEVQELLNSYINVLKEDKVVKENNFYTIDDYFNGMIYIMVKSNYIIGIINLQDKSSAKKLLNKVKI
jgi:hypothetical protein